MKWAIQPSKQVLQRCIHSNKQTMKTLLLFLLSLSLLACNKNKDLIASGGDIPQNEQQSYATVGPNDLLSIRVIGEADLSGDYRVSNDGTITFPWLQTIPVGGFLLGEIQDKIAKGLRDGYIRNPQVIVDIKEANSKKIYVFGQVRTPGTFRYKDHMTVIELVTLAGGLSADADPSKAYITRVRDGVEVTYIVRINDISIGKARNDELAPGDILTVPLRFSL
jgi:protein involved in polysaccharide export with SLBB domain